MKKVFCAFLSCLLLAGCAAPAVSGSSASEPLQTSPAPAQASGDETKIYLSDGVVNVEGGDSGAVFSSHDIIYYEDLDLYDSGNPYGEGTAEERHYDSEAAAHTVVNIAKPGTYRISGKLSAGQIRVDLGETAFTDPAAKVTLILDGADITCTVAPAILFLHVYECDHDWSEETAGPVVDTTAAGANLILAEGSVNTVTGSHVAKIYKDNGEQKKLWKQDGAVYSYMSMNVGGSGALDIIADNEGLDSELHLTINGGSIRIASQNDGINTNEDGISVTTINGGDVRIAAGLGAEGDGIDSNGYLVINGGTVVAAANPASDSGLDSDMGSYINGGTVVALGSAMDWAESDSDQVTMNLRFAGNQSGSSALVLKNAEGGIVFAYDPGEDSFLAEYARPYSGAILSAPALQLGETYTLWADGTLTGTQSGGFYTAVTEYAGGRQQLFTGSDLAGRGGHGGRDFPDRPEGAPHPDGRPDKPAGEPRHPDGMGPQDGMEPPELPGGIEPKDGMEPPELPEGELPRDEFVDRWPGANIQPGDPSTDFYMQDKVNAFTGIADA